MNITEEAIVSIAKSLLAISESLEIIAKLSKKSISENKKQFKNQISTLKILNEHLSIRNSNNKKINKSPKETIDEILRKEIFQ